MDITPPPAIYTRAHVAPYRRMGLPPSGAGAGGDVRGRVGVCGVRVP